MTNAEIAQFVKDYKEKARTILLIDRKSLSSVVRTKTSADDNRPSATAFGSAGIVIIVIILCSLVLCDIFNLLTFHRGNI